MDGSTGAADDLPDRGAVVLFDGVCNLCSWSVRFIHEHDDGSLGFAPLQSEVGRDLLAAHGLPTDYFDSLVYLRDGEAHLRSDGAVRIARHLDRPWRWLRFLGVLPRSVRDVGYDLLGRVRYRVFGKRRECMVPDGGLRGRFLDEQTASGPTTDSGGGS
jgi:predicted DCC family thiol-disulfide oxidoreductase YuxK